MPDRISEYMPEVKPGRMFEDMPERMREDMPDRMPEAMPEYVPSRMPARRRIDGRTSEHVADRIVSEPKSGPSVGTVTRRCLIRCFMDAEPAHPSMTRHDIAGPFPPATQYSVASCTARSLSRLVSITVMADVVMSDEHPASREPLADEEQAPPREVNDRCCSMFF